MVERIYKCNKCGNNIPVKRVDSIPEWTGYAGYGSRHDGEYLDVHFCPKCFDEVVQKMSEWLAISPFPFEEAVWEEPEEL